MKNMNNRYFFQLLEKAQLGDIDATFEIINEYAGVIFENSFINGKFNYDCNCYIEDKLLLEIKKFKKF